MITNHDEKPAPRYSLFPLGGDWTGSSRARQFARHVRIHEVADDVTARINKLCGDVAGHAARGATQLYDRLNALDALLVDGRVRRWIKQQRENESSGLLGYRIVVERRTDGKRQIYSVIVSRPSDDDKSP